MRLWVHLKQCNIHQQVSILTLTWNRHDYKWPALILMSILEKIWMTNETKNKFKRIKHKIIHFIWALEMTTISEKKKDWEGWLRLKFRLNPSGKFKNLCVMFFFNTILCYFSHWIVIKNKRRKCSHFNRASEKFNNMSKAMVFS